MAHIHFIAIGGAVMHNLALALKHMGHTVTGSDDEIFEPARSRLEEAQLLPASFGWYPEKITNGLDQVILGMHAKRDNPELVKAMNLGLPIASFPEYIGRLYQNKSQIVIAGSHGKTTTTSMIMHVLRYYGIEHDYLVGAQIRGYDHMVRISGAPLAVLEGDEYLSSCLDPKSKFHHYDPEIFLITGIAWDHYNVFPSYDDYLSTFIKRIQNLKAGSSLVYFTGDREAVRICERYGRHLALVPYGMVPHAEKFGQVFLEGENGAVPIGLFGDHNLQNAGAAAAVLGKLGINFHRFSVALKSFVSPSNRLELISYHMGKKVYRDFAHAPSKVKACIAALCKRYPDRRIAALIELHTYSSLNADFLPMYRDTAHGPQRVAVYFDGKALEIKGMKPLSEALLRRAFNRQDLLVLQQKEEIKSWLMESYSEVDIVVLLGSGSFGGLDISQFFAFARGI